MQSWGNYVKVFVNGQMMLGSMTTSEIENKLDDIKFLRIHKSYIVALDRIQRVKGNEAQLIGGTFLPIGTVYRKRLLESL
ncbi:LytR/AlgR family response regulator transcription factor [Pedobacter sp. ASV12]|uniref:LytR/AlgR family response regulator transcription factor n=1 Tax=Pedobacter sp. ASV12 TaxID=2795120 RepID=UPI0018EC248A